MVAGQVAGLSASILATCLAFSAFPSSTGASDVVSSAKVKLTVWVTGSGVVEVYRWTAATKKKRAQYTLVKKCGQTVYDDGCPVQLATGKIQLKANPATDFSGWEGLDEQACVLASGRGHRPTCPLQLATSKEVLASFRSDSENPSVTPGSSAPPPETKP